MFNIGDKVLIRKGLEFINEGINGCGVTLGMEKFEGEVCTISEKHYDILSVPVYRLEEDTKRWFWIGEFFELFDSKPVTIDIASENDLINLIGG